MSENIKRPRSIRIEEKDRARATQGLLKHLNDQNDKRLSAKIVLDKIEGTYNSNITFKSYFSTDMLEINIHLKQNNKKSRFQVEILRGYFQTYSPSRF